MISIEYMQEVSLKSHTAISCNSEDSDKVFKMALMVLLRGIAERLDAMTKIGGAE